jgi:hypothetical protein
MILSDLMAAIVARNHHAGEVCRLIANHHDLAIFESAPEVRALSSASIIRLQRSYDPVRLPPWPPPFATLRPLPSPLTGLPRLPEPLFRRAVPTTPADRAGARVDCFPAHTAFPKWQEGRHPHCHFRGLLRLHSRYGPPDCSTAQSGLCHEAPALPVEPLVSYQINRQLSGWNLPPLVIRAFGAHCHERTHSASINLGGCLRQSDRIVFLPKSLSALRSRLHVEFAIP